MHIKSHITDETIVHKRWNNRFFLVVNVVSLNQKWGMVKRVLHRPQTKNKSRFCGQIHEWKHFYLRFFYVRRSITAITSASPRIQKSTTLRSTLWCSHYSVAKRQQFSCPLGTATLSLKLENVVPGRWIFYFSYCGQVRFLLLLDRWAVVARTSIFSKNLVRRDVFLSSTAVKTHSAFFFKPYLFVCLGTSQADCGVGDIKNP